MHFKRSLLFAIALAVGPVSALASVHKMTEAEYEKLIDDLIGAIEKGSVGVGGGSGGSSSPGQPAEPSGGNEDGNSGNDDAGDGVGEDW